MPSNILATGTTAASSSDLTVAAGSATTVCLKDAVEPEAAVNVEIKTDAGTYVRLFQLVPTKPLVVLTAPATYRFTRIAGKACGVFSA